MSSLPSNASAAVLAAKAERARQQREAASAALDQRLYDQLQQLQKRWAEVDKTVDQQRDQLYAKAKDVVSSWTVKRDAARERNALSAGNHAKRMERLHQEKEARLAAWRQRTEAERKRKEDELARSRSSATTRFEEELRQDAARLNEAQARAAQRRRAFQQEKRRQLAERAEAAEAKEEEMWAARVRMEQQHAKRIAEVDAECKRKAKQAEEVLAARVTRVNNWRHDNAVWRAPAELPKALRGV